MYMMILALLSISLRDSSNVRLIGWWPYSFSYTVVSSGSYTYIGSGFAILIFDTNNPLEPHIVNKIPTNGTIQRLFIKYNYLYCANGLKGLKIFDISNPQNPILIGELEMAGTAQDIVVSDTFAYVVTAVTSGGGSLFILNVATPSNPEIKGNYSFSSWCLGIEVADSFAYVATNKLKILNVANPSAPFLVDSIPMITGSATDVEICDTFLYFTEHGAPDYLRIANIANPSNPIICSNTPFAQGIMRIQVVDSLCYIAHSDFYILNVNDPYHPYIVSLAEPGGTDIFVKDTIAFLTGGTLNLLNVANPNVPILISNYELPGSIRNIAIVDTLGYFAMNNRLWILNIVTPHNPFEVGKWIPYSIPWVLDVAGRNRLVYCACGDTGLKILDVTNPQSPVVLGGINTHDNAYNLALFDTFCYIADGYAGLQIIDVADSTSPIILGSYPTNFARDVDVNSGICYVADNDSGLKIIDARNPSNPILLSRLIFPNERAKKVLIIDTLLYLITRSNTSFSGYLRLLNVANPSAPVELGIYIAPYEIRGISVQQNLIYIGYDDIWFGDENHLEVIDFSDPLNPIVTGYYYLPSEGSTCAMYNNYVLVGTSNAGVMIFEYYGPGIDEMPKGRPTEQFNLIMQNPAKNVLYLKYFAKNEDISLKIYDVAGRLYYKKEKQHHAQGWFNEKLMLNSFSQGVYFISLETKEAKCLKKFVVIK
ncbi:MAG: T9SS type A sorting domain-containing protein [candidate division WOR-3 bacterium]